MTEPSPRQVLYALVAAGFLAVVAILIVGAALTVGALVLDGAVEPPIWVHLVWVPIGLLLTAGGLRFAKALLLAQEYQHKAREGQIVR